MASYTIQQLPKDLQAYLAENPEASRFLRVGKLLVQSDVQPAKQPSKRLSLNHDEKEKYTETMIQELSASSNPQEVAEAIMDLTIQIGLQHAVYIDCAFIAKNYPPRPALVEEFKTLMGAYVDFLLESAVIATPMAAHGALFDTLIIPYCANEVIPLQERQRRAQTYVEQARKHGEQARNMVAKMDQRLRDFENKWDSLTGERGFPRERCPIKQNNWSFLRPDVQFDLPVLSQLVSQNGAFSASLTIKGLLELGTPEALNAALSIAVATGRSQLSSDNIATKPCGPLYAFQDGAEAIKNYWSYTDIDSLAIETWLKRGANRADLPAYMKLYFEKGARIYLSISYRLTGYATAIALANPLLWMTWFEK